MSAAFIFLEGPPPTERGLAKAAWYVVGREQARQRARGPFSAVSRSGVTFHLTPTSPLGGSEALLGGKKYKARRDGKV